MSDANFNNVNDSNDPKAGEENIHKHQRVPHYDAETENGDNIEFVDEYEDISTDSSISDEMNRSQFERYVKEVFGNSVTKPLNFRDFQKNNALLTELPLPQDMKEPFFDTETAIYYLTVFSPLIKRYDEVNKKQKKLKGLIGDNYDEIQKFYLKWAVASSETDREYFAASALKLIEKNNNKDNFFKYILQALIFAYDKKNYYDPQRALRILTSLEENLLEGSFDPVLRDDFLFVIKLLRGIVYMKLDEMEEARNEFFTLRSRSMHSPAPLYFYLVTELKMGQYEKAAELFSELLNMDIIILNYAIRHNNVHIFEYELRNAYIYSVFHLKECVHIFPYIQAIVEKQKADPHLKLSNLKQWYNNLIELELQNYFTKEITSDLQFFKQFFDSLLTARNGFIMIVFENLVEKFLSAIVKLKTSIENKYHSDINNELKMHDKNIREREEEIAVIRDEIEKLEDKLKDHLEELKIRIEKTAEIRKRDIEEKIQHLDEVNESRYSEMLRKAMLNNIIITAIMFIVGGVFGGLSQTAETGLEGESNFIQHAISSGLQWAAIIFLLGIIASIVLTVFSKSKSRIEKSKLENSLANVDKEKEREDERVQEEMEFKRDKMERANNDRINKLLESIRSNEADKREKELELRKEVQQEINTIFNRLDQVHK